MTAPDHFADANLTSFAGGGRPHDFLEISIWDQTFYAWQLWRLQERVTAVGGDFFEALPAVDLYLLRYTLHDWDDVACIRILQNCRRAMLPGGYVAVIER